jgi:AcrR family transcriptional regulator
VLSFDALAVIDARGYKNCSMADIAREVGMSSRTLHRYFPTKAEIVWGTIDTSFRNLRERLDAADPETEIIAAVRLAVVGTFSDYREAESVARIRLRIIGQSPELHANTSEPFRLWRHEVTRFVAGRIGASADDFLPTVIGIAVQATSMTALTWWATNETSDRPDVLVDRALASLENGFASTLAR